MARPALPPLGGAARRAAGGGARVARARSVGGTVSGRGRSLRDARHQVVVDARSAGARLPRDQRADLRGAPRAPGRVLPVARSVVVARGPGRTRAVGVALPPRDDV